MIKFTAILKKFGTHGDKTGWTYIEIPAALAEKLKPGNRRSFRVKGRLDEYPIEQVALLPLGEGDFFMAINATMRKATGKREGASLKIQLELDDATFKLNEEFVACLEDEPEALAFFNSLGAGHQRYFSNWIDSAKTEGTRATRIAQAINGLLRGMEFGEMIRAIKVEKERLKG